MRLASWFLVIMVWPFTASCKSPPMPHEEKEHDGGWDSPRPRTTRVSFGFASTTVVGYPSSGESVLVLPYCSGVDMEFLGLSRLERADRDRDPQAEDRHCDRMRKLGAWEFGTMEEYEQMSGFDRERWWDMDFVVAAWEGESVWVVKSKLGDAAENDFGAIWNVFTMEEKAEVVKKLGGTFYKDPKDCPDLDLDGKGPLKTASRNEL